MAANPFTALQVVGKAGTATPADINRVQDQVRQAFQKVANQPGGVTKVGSKDGTVIVSPKTGSGDVDLSVSTKLPILNPGSVLPVIAASAPDGILSPSATVYLSVIGSDGKTYVVPAWELKTTATVPTDGLQLWLDAGSGVSLSGSDVVSWLDKSTNAYLPTATGSPLFAATEIGGNPAVQFSFGNFLSLTQALMPAGSDRDVFAVAKFNGNGGGTILGTGLASLGFNFGFQPGSSVMWNQWFGGGSFWWKNWAGGAGTYTGTSHRFRWTQDSGAPSFALDGTDVGSLTTVGTYSADAGDALFSVGRTWNVNGSEFDGWVAEIIVYDRVLSPSEAGQIAVYFSAKYGF